MAGGTEGMGIGNREWEWGIGNWGIENRDRFGNRDVHLIIYVSITYPFIIYSGSSGDSYSIYRVCIQHPYVNPGSTLYQPRINPISTCVYFVRRSVNRGNSDGRTPVQLFYNTTKKCASIG